MTMPPKRPSLIRAEVDSLIPRQRRIGEGEDTINISKFLVQQIIFCSELLPHFLNFWPVCPLHQTALDTTSWVRSVPVASKHFQSTSRKRQARTHPLGGVLYLFSISVYLPSVSGTSYSTPYKAANFGQNLPQVNILSSCVLNF